MKKVTVFIIVAVVIWSCSTKKIVTTPDTKTVVATDIASGEVAEGKSIYENNCAKCHKLYDTKSFSAEEWQPILISMQKKAHLTDAQRIKIYNYITSQ